MEDLINYLRQMVADKKSQIAIIDRECDKKKEYLIAEKNRYLNELLAALVLNRRR